MAKISFSSASLIDVLKVKSRWLMAGCFVDGAVVAAFKNGPELAEQRVGRLFDQDHIPLTNLGHVHVVDGSFQLLKLGEKLFVFKGELDPLVWWGTSMK